MKQKKYGGGRKKRRKTKTSLVWPWIVPTLILYHIIRQTWRSFTTCHEKLKCVALKASSSVCVGEFQWEHRVREK